MAGFLGLVYIAFAIYCVYWVYNEEEGMAGIVWGILAFCFSFITLAVYAILNRSRTAALLAGGWAAFWFIQALVAVLARPALPH